MMKTALIFTFTLGLILFGLSSNDVEAQIFTNNAFTLEGSGFAVTEEMIKTSQIDFVMSTGTRSGSTTNFLVEDGFITLNNEDFIVTEITGTLLRDAKYVRISGTAVNDFSEEISLRFFGRLIEDTPEGSVFSFTGRIIQDNTSHKIIYITKLAELTSIPKPTPTSQIEETFTIHIARGSSSQSLGADYIETGIIRQEAIKAQGTDSLRIRYFSQDRITIEPGTTITFVNDDTVSHTVVSGTGLGSNSRITGTPKICEIDPTMIEGFRDLRSGSNQRQTNCDFTLDGRINTGEILPGESIQVTFEEAGFYRIIDPDYHWMQMIVYSFPEVDSLIIRQGDNQLGN